MSGAEPELDGGAGTIRQEVIGVDLSQEMLRRARHVAKERQAPQRRVRRGDALKLPLERAASTQRFVSWCCTFDPHQAVSVAELCRITRGGGLVIVVDLVQHNQEWMREQMAHRWLGFERSSIEEWFRDARVTEITYELTGAYAGEKMARNGNRPVEIFVARAHYR